MSQGKGGQRKCALDNHQMNLISTIKKENVQNTTLAWPMSNNPLNYRLVWFTPLNYFSWSNLPLNNICLFCFSTFKLIFNSKFYEGTASTIIYV